MTIKYLQNKNDKSGAVYRVNFQTKKNALVKVDHDMGIPPSITGSFRDGGFMHGPDDSFKEVTNPLH